MVKVTISQIPDFLKQSTLYKSLSELDNDLSFDIQDDFFKNEIIINTDQDVISYIEMFDYWMIDIIPNDFYKAILKIKDDIDINLLKTDLPMPDLVKQIKIIINISNKNMCSYFSSIGNLELLKLSHENGYQWLVEVCEKAVKNGNLDCLKYAYENGCPWDKYTCCDDASENGHLECLKYARENGCPWNEYTCEKAARNGHLDCLKYAHEKLYIFFKKKYII